jgi:hypothetical protein
MTTLTERLRRVNLHPFFCRFWIQDDAQSEKFFDDIINIATDALQTTPLAGDVKTQTRAIAKTFLKLDPAVNAVEVLYEGEGVVVYRDWP